MSLGRYLGTGGFVKIFLDLVLEGGDDGGVEISCGGGDRLVADITVLAVDLRIFGDLAM